MDGSWDRPEVGGPKTRDRREGLRKRVEEKEGRRERGRRKAMEDGGRRKAEPVCSDRSQDSKPVK